MKTGRGIASPFVEVEVVGADYDSISKYKTGTKGTVCLLAVEHGSLFILAANNCSLGRVWGTGLSYFCMSL